MDYKARLDELDRKLEREGLTELERAEINHYSTLALLELKKIFERGRDNGTNQQTESVN